MINIKQELAKGGVAGLFEACQLTPRAVEYGRGFGGDLRGCWESMPNPGALLGLAMELGVPMEEVVEALCGCIRMMTAEYQEKPHETALAILDVVEHEVAREPTAGSWEVLKAASEPGSSTGCDWTMVQ